MEGLNRAIDVQKAVGALSGDIDVTKMIDTQFLADDIKPLK
jgi:NitT/TauT family transport system substrate-binding protein